MTFVPPELTPSPAAAPAAASAEHRVAPRHRVLKSAKIVFDDWTAMDCAIRDISDTGAKIRVEGASRLPHKFRLLITSDNAIRDVQVAWFHHDMVGVAFLGEAKRAPLRKF